MNAIAHIHVKESRLTKQRFVAGGAAAVAVAGGFLLRIRLRFHNHAPQQLPNGWRFTSRQPMSSGATNSAGRAKKDGVKAGRVLVAMGVAWGMGEGCWGMRKLH